MKTLSITLLSIALYLLAGVPAILGQNSASTADVSAIRTAALDYIEGFYSGDVVRMEKAIHPDLNKATPRDLPQTGRTTLNYTTWSGLMEFTRAGAGLLSDTARHIGIEILNTGNEVADVKAVSANFTDYLQLARLDGQWKIVNVMFTSGLNGPTRLKNFDPEAEKEAIERTALAYLAGLTGGDAGKLQAAIDPEYSRISLFTLPQSGKTSLRRQRYEAMTENALAGIGKQDEIYRNNRAEVLDVTDGLAVVKCRTTATVETVQLYKGNGQWKILNSLVRPDNTLTLEQALAPIAGEAFPDFTLPVYGGGEFSLEKYRGKKVLLIFPRGYLVNNWCAYCPYQYLELEQMEKTRRIMSAYDVQIVFVLPYSMEMIRDWQERFPEALAAIENNKHPQTAPAAGSIQEAYSAWVRQHFPLTFDVKPDDPHTWIPVLSDENRDLSRQLKIFTGFWDGVAAEQNMASVFIIDQEGILQFKYIGQMTEDRPGVGFLMDLVRKMK